MGATNAIPTGSKQFFKLKEVESDIQAKGEYRFFEQKKIGDKWGDGEMFNQLSGTVEDVCVKEYEYQGEKKKQLCVVLRDAADVMEFSLGLRAMTAQGILNTLAGNNGFDLVFTCGKPRKGKDGKFYPSFYINKMYGATNEEKRTNWKWQIADLPKITTEVYKGQKVKVGQEQADLFWLDVVKLVKESLTNQSHVKQAQQPEPQGDDLPF